MTMLSGSEEVLKFQPLVPPMFTVIQQAVATAHDDVVTSALDAVAEVAESSVPMLAPYTSQVFAFLLGLLMNQDADVGVVDCAGQVVINLVTTRPKAMIKPRVVPQIMSTALQMAMDYDEEEHADLHSSGTAAFQTGGSGPASRSGVAERILDKLAIAIPSQHMLPALMESVMPALTHAQWKVRRAALVALAMVAEGCVEPMRAALDRLLPMLLPRLKVRTLVHTLPCRLAWLGVACCRLTAVCVCVWSAGRPRHLPGSCLLDAGSVVSALEARHLGVRTVLLHGRRPC